MKDEQIGNKQVGIIKTHVGIIMRNKEAGERRKGGQSKGQKQIKEKVVN